MDPVQLQELIAAGENLLFSKYFLQAALTVVIWDHLITLSDEVEYIWKKEKTWAFWIFLVSRYSILVYQTWNTISSFWLGYTQEVCDRTVKLEGYYYVFTLTLGLVFLTMRVYAVTETSKYVIVVSGILVTSSLATGLWFVSVPSAKAVQMPTIPLDLFHACIIDTGPEANAWAYGSQVALAEVVAFVCLVVFIFRFKANQGQSRMARLLRTILQDGILYFFVMAGFHIAMWILTALHRPSFVPPISIMVLIPVMVSRLVVSLRKTLDASVVQVWDGDHFTAAGSVVHEMMDFARPLPPSKSFSVEI